MKTRADGRTQMNLLTTSKQRHSPPNNIKKNEEMSNNNKMDICIIGRIVECQGYHTAVNIYRKTETYK
jgi:hypothetical protein